MTEKRPLYKIPHIGGPAIEGSLICGDEIEFAYNMPHHQVRGGFRFSKIRASRTRSMLACARWHVEGVIATLVEVVDSDWVAELQRDTGERQRRSGQNWEMHHYMIFLENSGCSEVIAESWELLPERIEPD